LQTSKTWLLTTSIWKIPTLVDGLSDFIFLDERHNKIPMLLDYGRDTKAKQEMDILVSRATNENIHAAIQINGDMNIHAGDIIELIIPSTDEQGTIMAELYSGKYLVNGVRHKIIPGTAKVSFVTTLDLVRCGLNVVEDDGGLVR